MPAKSEAQRRLFAIAAHAPEKLYARNKDVGDLPQKTLHDFAATKEKNLPYRASTKDKKKAPPRKRKVYGEK